MRDVAGIANRDAMVVRGIAQHIDDLEGPRLLALERVEMKLDVVHRKNRRSVFALKQPRGPCR